MIRAADAAACSQCGLPLPRAPAGGAPTAARFCCLGCEIVASIGGPGEAARSGLLLARIGLAAFLSMNVMMIAFALFGATPSSGPLPGWVTLLRWLSLVLATPALLILVPPLAKSGLARAGGARLRLELLVVVAAVAAYLLSAWNTLRERGDIWFDTATMVLLVVLLGSWLAARARTQARADLARLFAAADTPYSIERAGARTTAREAELQRGDLVAVGRGARVPVDGTVARSDGARVDGSLLTGEPGARPIDAGARLRAGEVVREGSLELCAEAVGADSTLGRLQAALGQALARPSATVRAVDRAAHLLVLATASCALAVLAWFAWRGDFEIGLQRALALLVVACPCSIAIAAPLTLTRALQAAAQLGAVVQSLDGFERLGLVSAVAADKTGTLTTGDGAELTLARRDGARIGGELRALLAALARASQHPIAIALRESLAGIEPAPLREVRDEPGVGLRAVDARGRVVTLCRGDAAGDRAGALHSTLAIDDRVVADVHLAERLRDGVAALGAALRERGLAFTLLSGDDERRVQPLARSLAAAGHGGLTPEQKAARLAVLREPGRGIAWLGDGANDAIALAGADVSIVVDRRLEWLADAADLVLLGERVGALPQLIDVARRARRRIVGALAWAALYHVVTLGLGVTGLLTPALAALAMALGSVAVVHASLRPLVDQATAARSPLAGAAVAAAASGSPPLLAGANLS